MGFGAGSVSWRFIAMLNEVPGCIRRRGMIMSKRGTSRKGWGVNRRSERSGHAPFLLCLSRPGLTAGDKSGVEDNGPKE